MLKEPLPSEPADVEAADAGGSGTRCLVVDDNVDCADSLAQLLRLSGHETRVAHDGVEALRTAERFRPDIIVLDLAMPGLDGFETCRHLRAQPWGHHVTVIALSGWGQEEHRRRTREAGFDAHLLKPVEYAVLARLLSRR